MNKIQENKKRLSDKKANELWQSFNFSFYWLNVLVKNKDISKSQAGKLINALTNKIK